MPEIVVHLAAGRSVEQKQALMKDIADAVVKNLGVAPDRVVVQILESAKTDKSRGGVPFSEL
jgi:4-oxalocrotonate tautomerase